MSAQPCTYKVIVREKDDDNCYVAALARQETYMP